MAMGLLGGCASAQPAAGVADYVIRGGQIVDGAGGAAFVGDVAVSGDRIVYVGPAYGGDARQEIDADGMTVTPGFIDAHSHTDRSIADPDKSANEAVIREGVTTIVGGPDGGAAPAKIKSYLKAYEQNGVGTNVAFYVGHNGIRREVMGDAARAPTAAELAKMRALVREGMQLGALGFSTGLMYEPGLWSETAEVVALAKEAAPFGGVYDSHVRSPVAELLKSDAEAIEIGRRAGIDVKISHLKIVGLDNAGKLDDVVDLIVKARAEGRTVVTDQYPYDGAATRYLHDIFVLPPTLEEATKAATEGEDRAAAVSHRLALVQAALRDDAQREEIRDVSEHGVDGGFSWIKAVGYGSIRVVDAPGSPELVGEHISELAAQRREDGFDALVDLVMEADEPVLATLGSVAESDVVGVMRQDWNMVASDGSWVRETENPTGGHPRSAGAFARVLGRYVREQHVLTLEEAVWKMSGFPAQFLHLADRGELTPGRAADIAIFDAGEIRDRSTWENPTLYAQGMRDVMVNGVFVLRKGDMTGALPGRFVPRQAKP